MSRPVLLVPKLNLGTHLSRQLHCLSIALVLLSLTSCKKKPIASTSPDRSHESYQSQPSLETPTPKPTLTLPIDGSIALTRARTLCSLGSRAYATPGYRQTLAYLRSELTRLGWNTVFQAFDTDTPLGKRTYTNLIATWPTDKPADQQIILTAHYDSPGSLSAAFPAASSGAAGCGILLEIAERLSAKNESSLDLDTLHNLASRLTLVFLDGEEPTQQISTTDGLSGSRFFLHSLSENGQLTHYRALLALGAIGHTGAKWTLPTLTDPVLNQTLQTFVAAQKWDNQITPFDRPSWGPHLPALQAGLPATFLNDALSPALGTADDTPETLTTESLRRAALASLQLLQLPSAAKTN